MDAALFDEGMGVSQEDWIRLRAIRNKIADSGYVEGAVTKIASFLCVRYDEEKPDERRSSK